MYPDVLSIEINALTPIWTGDENGSGDKLCPTGLIGSFRWWYEVLIRGLDGYACDPTSEKSCRIDENKLKNEDEIKKSICPACYLFGCTGWQRKFRFEIRKIKNGSIGPLKTSSIKANEKLMLCFIPLKEFDMVEKSLLYTALKIVSGYGSIGGKTTHKPSEINGKNKFERHKDYGLFKIEDMPDNNTTRQTVDDYIANSFKPPEISQKEKWPDLRYFFFSQKALNRLDINKVIGLDRKGKLINNVSDYQKFLRGRRGVSKKIFSFHTDNRTWGYLNKKLFVSWKNELEKMTGMNTKWGKDIIDEFFK